MGLARGRLRHRFRARTRLRLDLLRIERSNGLGPLKAVGYSHLFVLYGLLPSVYGWRAVARELTGRTGWAKTAREAEPAQATESARSVSATVPPATHPAT